MHRRGAGEVTAHTKISKFSFKALYGGGEKWSINSEFPQRISPGFQVFFQKFHQVTYCTFWHYMYWTLR